MDSYCDLFKDVSKSDNNEPINLYCDFVPEYEENKTLLYATQHIKSVNSRNKGIWVMADSDIPKDKILIQEQPTVLQVNPLCLCVGDKEKSVYRCHNCGAACRIFYTCDGCNVCIFCSRICLLNAYKDYHRYECYGIQRHFWSMSDTDYNYISLRMMLYGASKEFDTDPVGSCYGNKKNNYPYIYQMKSNFNRLSWAKINEILYSSVKNLFYLILKTTFFNQYKERNYKLNDFHLYIGGLMVKHYCQAETNSVLIKFYNLSAGFGFNVLSGSGKAICPTIALLNHACSPNATIIVYNGFIVVKSLKHIRKGDEITICYKEVDPMLPVSDRQLITEEIFHFTCRCTFCNYEKTWSEAPYKCSICVTGKATRIDMDNGKTVGYCLACLKPFNFDRILESIKIVQICTNIYNVTHSIDHITRIAECYTNIFPPNSWYLLDVYKILYQKHVLSEERPMEVLKYGLLCFNILECHLPRLYIPLIISKMNFAIRAVNMSKLSEDRVVSQNEFETMKIFVAQVAKLQEDLMFYLPEERLSYHHDLMLKVHGIFQNMEIK